MSGNEATAIPAHLSSEFLVWLWWRSEQTGGKFDLGAPAGTVDVWVDDRLAFRQPSDNKVTAVVTGENPAHALEARAALAGGKVVHDLRIGMRRDEHEFSASLRGAALDVGGLKLPQVLSETPEEAVVDRMFLYEEFWLVIGALLDVFGTARASASWGTETLPAIKGWLTGQRRG